MSERARHAGTVVRVNGPVLTVRGLRNVAVGDMLHIGGERLVGEVVAVDVGTCTAQVYDSTGGLAPGAPVTSDAFPLSARLGPGLLGGVFDGTLRRLDAAREWLDSASRRGLADAATWDFTPADGALPGVRVGEGFCLGHVREGAGDHPILVPPGRGGILAGVRPAGGIAAGQAVATIDGEGVFLHHRWPVRQARPVRRRLGFSAPLRTGQRVIDLLFPILKGSTAGVPGGFGTGKTLLLQQIAKWCDADVIVYVGCGERGNEMADILADFAVIEDPRTGRPLRERTVVIANTSNMPVMGREASIFTAVTVAEYFRDMGRHAVLIADSTSRWAEALRELTSRTGELPTEEGYPASLASVLSAFYERAGTVETLGGGEGSVTIIGAVSPPGGDMTEPVTAQTRRFTRVVWSLDRGLAYGRHYPAVQWHDSFSMDLEAVTRLRAQAGDIGAAGRHSAALALLTESDRLDAVVDLIGEAALSDDQRITRLAARLLRDSVLQQSALSAVDSFCETPRQEALLAMALDIHAALVALLRRGVAASRIEVTDFSAVVRAREQGDAADVAGVDAVRRRILATLEGLA